MQCRSNAWEQQVPRHTIIGVGPLRCSVNYKHHLSFPRLYTTLSTPCHHGNPNSNHLIFGERYNSEKTVLSNIIHFNNWLENIQALFTIRYRSIDENFDEYRMGLWGCSHLKKSEHPQKHLQQRAVPVETRQS